MLRTAVQPAALREGGSQEAAHGSAPDAVVLDVRNAYEWDAGHFVGAARPLEVPPSLLQSTRVTSWLNGCRSKVAPLGSSLSCRVALEALIRRGLIKSERDGFKMLGVLETAKARSILPAGQLQ